MMQAKRRHAMSARDLAIQSAELAKQHYAALTLQKRILRRQAGFARIHGALEFAWHACVGSGAYLTRNGHASMLRRLYLVEVLENPPPRLVLSPFDAQRSVEESWAEVSHRTPEHNYISRTVFNRFWFHLAAKHVEATTRRGFAYRVAGWISRRVMQISMANINEGSEEALQRSLKRRTCEWRTDHDVIKLCMPKWWGMEELTRLDRWARRVGRDGGGKSRVRNEGAWSGQRGVRSGG